MRGLQKEKVREKDVKKEMAEVTIKIINEACFSALHVSTINILHTDSQTKRSLQIMLFVVYCPSGKETLRLYEDFVKTN